MSKVKYEKVYSEELELKGLKKGMDGLAIEVDHKEGSKVLNLTLWGLYEKDGKLHFKGSRGASGIKIPINPEVLALLIKHLTAIQKQYKEFAKVIEKSEKSTDIEKLAKNLDDSQKLALLKALGIEVPKEEPKKKSDEDILAELANLLTNK